MEKFNKQDLSRTNEQASIAVRAILLYRVGAPLSMLTMMSTASAPLLAPARALGMVAVIKAKKGD